MTEGSTDGTLADWGMLEQISFMDPDGMEAEVSVVKDGRPLSFAEHTLEPPPQG